MLPNTDQYAPMAHWPIRLAMAGIMLFHGPAKFMMPGMAEMMGLPVPVWYIVGAAEIAAGLGFIIGGIRKDAMGHLMTRLSGLAVIPVMLGAVFLVHWPRWSFAPSDSHPMGGMEFQVLILAVAIYAFLTGFAPPSERPTIQD